MTGKMGGGRRCRASAHAAGLVFAVVAAACSGMGGPGTMGGTPLGPSAVFGSNGERIYTTATSESGSAITAQGGPGVGMMRGMACVTCHGSGGHGGPVTMGLWSFTAPDISWAMLTGAHEDHDPYTDATIRQAITAGVDPAGEALDSMMPRWSMAPADLDDLLAYLRTLR